MQGDCSGQEGIKILSCVIARSSGSLFVCPNNHDRYAIIRTMWREENGMGFPLLKTRIKCFRGVEIVQAFFEVDRLGSLSIFQ